MKKVSQVQLCVAFLLFNALFLFPLIMILNEEILVKLFGIFLQLFLASKMASCFLKDYERGELSE